MLSFEEVWTLKDGFFAKRVVDTIRAGGELDTDKHRLFQRVLEYLETINNGRKQVQTGNLVEHPLKSISAYRKAIQIISVLGNESTTSEDLSSLLDDVKREVQAALREKYISAEHLTQTYTYFIQAKKLAVNEAAKESINKQESVTWQVPMQF